MHASDLHLYTVMYAKILDIRFRIDHKILFFQNITLHSVNHIAKF